MSNYSMDLKKTIAKNEKERYYARNENCWNVGRVSNN